VQASVPAQHSDRLAERLPLGLGRQVVQQQRRHHAVGARVRKRERGRQPLLPADPFRALLGPGEGEHLLVAVDPDDLDLRSRSRKRDRERPPCGALQSPLPPDECIVAALRGA